MDKIRDGCSDFLKRTAENFGISETSVRRYVKECAKQGILEEDESLPAGWKLRTVSENWELKNDGELEEDSIFWEYIHPHLDGLSDNAKDIWYYAFTEIMNNAIEHSGGSRILFALRQDPLYTEISITDNGTGIFRNIQRYMREREGITLDSAQAALELYKEPGRALRGGHLFCVKNAGAVRYMVRKYGLCLPVRRQTQICAVPSDFLLYKTGGDRNYGSDETGQ